MIKATLKDTSISFILEKVIQKYYVKDFTDTIEFNINSRTKKITFSGLLKGETAPITIEIDDYRIIQKEDKYFFEYSHLRTSREWMNIAINKYLNDASFEIPSYIAKLANLIA